MKSAYNPVTLPTRLFAFSLLVLLLQGCNTGIVTHDQTRAAELMVDFLSSLKSEDGIKLAYAWTDDRYKEDVSAADFRRKIARMRNLNQGANIELAGYETIGPVETFIVYASSAPEAGNLFYRFVLSGSRTLDYYLLNFEVKEAPFKPKGIYQAYEEGIGVDGV